jgi:hypothetical protein
MDKQSLPRRFSAASQSSPMDHLTRVSGHLSTLLLVFLVSVVIVSAGDAQTPTHGLPAKPTPQRILVKVRPALAQRIEAVLPTQGPSQARRATRWCRGL